MERRVTGDVGSRPNVGKSKCRQNSVWQPEDSAGQVKVAVVSSSNGRHVSLFYRLKEEIQKLRECVYH